MRNCIFWSARKAIHHPYCDDPAIQFWLSSPTLSNLLTTITSSMLTNKISSEEMLFLKQALNQNISEGKFKMKTRYYVTTIIA